MIRLIWIFLGLAVLFLIPFLIWGNHWDWSSQDTVAWLKQYGRWGWLVALILLMGDLFLPIPSTAVMSGLGLVYGPLWGGLIGSTGSVCSGMIAYGLCRLFGEKAVVKLLGKDDQARGKELFLQYGGWLVALSRWLPLLPEVIACMAGFLRMPWPTFLIALICGALPMAFTFALVGHMGSDHPTASIMLSALAPPILWWLIGKKMMRPPQK
ncbi:MAG: VTT domain-containing protein [Verrucomicrobia bacterium]|jgi:uncharacterized membrane protein YdjX (TVP38/TMEM64 family)|nr:VTT domain-containing protein [Verrucomicrobiota bacterium]